MVTEKIGGENFDEYLQGAIDALLSIEPRLTDYKSTIEGGGITLEFNVGSTIPIGCFMRICNFIDKCGADGDLYISPNTENKVKIRFLYDS